MRAADWWEAATDPIRMLDRARGRLTDRAALLFACGCARRAWDRLEPAHREAVGLAERAADAADPDERAALLRAAAAAVAGHIVAFAYQVFEPRTDAAPVVRAAALLLQTVDPPDDRPAAVGLGELLASGRGGWPHPGQAAVLRCVAGNPFRKATFDPAWRTSDVLALAAGVAADGGFDRLPVLADALQDAGCSDPHLLAHLRRDPTHARGCWVLDHILNPG